MKVCLITNSEVGISGYGLRVMPIIKELCKHHHQVVVFCRNYEKSLKHISNLKIKTFFPFVNKIVYLIEGLKYYLISRKSGSKLSDTFNRFIDSVLVNKINNFDILCSWENLPKTLKSAKDKKIKTIKDISMMRSAGAKKIYGKITNFYDGVNTSIIEQETFDNSDYFLAPSEITKKTLVALGIQENKIFVSPFGVDIQKFQIGNKKEDDILKLLFVGVIRKRKRVELILKAMKRLKNEKIKLILCGRIHQEENTLIEKYKKDVNIEHIGFVKHDKLPEIYQKADVFVFPSLIEGSAKVIYEAMASGLPIITTATSGSIIKNGVDGFIVPIENVGKIQEKISFFLNNPNMINKMGIKARKNVERFSWESYGEKIVKIFEKVNK